MTSTKKETTGKGRKVTVTIRAEMIREFEDGSARVDADGIELPVYGDEWEYNDEHE